MSLYCPVEESGQYVASNVINNVAAYAVTKLCDFFRVQTCSFIGQRWKKETISMIIITSLDLLLQLYHNNNFLLHKICHICLFVLALTSLLNIWGHIATVPAWCSGTLTNVLPHKNTMSQTKGITTQPVKVYRYGADLSLCYQFMWNVTREYTTTHFYVLGQTRPGNHFSTFHTNTHQRTINFMMPVRW